MANFGFATGNLAAEPKIFVNKDGSHTAIVRAYVEKGYANSEGKYDDTCLEFKAFVPASNGNRKTIYDIATTGDAVEIEYHLEADNYTKDDKTVYSQVARLDRMKFANRSPQRNNTKAEAKQDSKSTKAEAPAVDDAFDDMESAV